MIRKKRIKKARYNGAAFYIEANETCGGRRIATHEFPYADTPATEDLGKKAKHFGVAGFVLGALYKEDAKKLQDALERDGIGTLDHPYLGRNQKVRCLNYRVAECNREYGIIQFFMTFCEAGVLPQMTVPVQSPSLFGKVLKAAHEASDSLSQAAETIDQWTEALEDELAPLMAFRQSMGDVTTAIAGLKDATRQVSKEPATLLYAFKTALELLVSSPLSALTIVTALSASFDPLLGLGSTTRNPLKGVASQALACTLLLQIGSVVIRKNERASEQEKAHKIFLARCDQFLKHASSVAFIDVIQELKAQTIAQVKQRASTELTTVSYATNSLLLTHELYGEISREPELVALNPFPHPGFIQSGTEVVVA